MLNFSYNKYKKQLKIAALATSDKYCKNISARYEKTLLTAIKNCAAY